MIASQFEEGVDAADVFEVALLQKLLQLLLQIPQPPHLGRILRFMRDIPQINP